MNQKANPDRLVQIITGSAHQIWMAGLGALSLAEKEGGKIFETLSRLGETIQSSTLNTAGLAKQAVAGGKSTATGTLDKLEEMFELRVGRALNALQIPTARDIKDLTKRVNKLSSAVNELGATETTAAKPAAARKKTARTRDAVKKTSAKKKTAKTRQTVKKKTAKKKTAKTRQTVKKKPARKKKAKTSSARPRRKRSGI